MLLISPPLVKRMTVNVPEDTGWCYCNELNCLSVEENGRMSCCGLCHVLWTTQHMTSAKSLGLEQDYWSNVGEIGKRNSWWSKKSLESTPDYQRLLQDSAYKESDQDSSDETEPDTNIPSLYSCYVQTCAPEFVQCAKNSRSHQGFSACKAKHHLCALQCWVDLTESKFV
ncbi:hypothetical protein Btru_065163 [Bulinus truncatus]|nr:hypothetical protein Btru_065163 [Bulinus truncatus]